MGPFSPQKIETHEDEGIPKFPLQVSVRGRNGNSISAQILGWRETSEVK
jgi:hypothetical protein